MRAAWSQPSALDLDDDGEHHRPSLRPLVQVLREAVLDLGLEQRDLGYVVARCLDRSRDTIRGAGDHWVLRAGNEAAGDDLRTPDQGAGLLVDRHDDQKHAI